MAKALKDSDVASLEVRRSGPLVIVVSGDAIPDESHRLIETVHFQADLVAIPQPTKSEIGKTAQLLRRHRRDRDCGWKRCTIAWVLPGWRQGALPHRAG